MATRAVTRAYDDALRPVGLKATQLLLLIAVSTEGGMSITALASEMGMDRSTLTRNLVPLEAEGLVARGDEGWRRSRALTLTQEGRQRIKRALPLWQGAQRELHAKLGEQGWTLVHQGLDLLIRAADAGEG